MDDIQRIQFLSDQERIRIVKAEYALGLVAITYQINPEQFYDAVVADALLVGAYVNTSGNDTHDINVKLIS